MIALVQVPAKVGTGFALVNLLPGSPPDLGDPEARAGGVGVEGHAKGVPQARGERLLAHLHGLCVTVDVTAVTI